MRRILCFLIPLILLATGCEKESSMLVTRLGNDCINRYYYVPFIVGSEMEFAYAMFMPRGSGRLEEASVRCSIPGAEGTYLDHVAYSTDEYGQDKPWPMGNPNTVEDGCHTVTFTADTIAATLRFHYIIPEEARGKKIDFHFSVRASNGQTADYDITGCQVRKMDMKLDIKMTPTRCFFSIDKMKALTAAEADFEQVPVDFAWAYSTAVTDKSDRSGFFNAARLDDFSTWYSFPTLSSPANDTKKMYRYNIIEPQLGRQEFDGFYIDDRDFETLRLDCDTAGLIGINARNGFWVETADGRYRAYIYCNETGAESCTVSIKRYTL